MKLIDADALFRKYLKTKNLMTAQTDYAQGARDIIEDMVDAPTIDAVEVIRCKDCKWYKHEEEDEVGMGWCTNFKPASNEHFICWDNWYCGDGKRKDG